ncbi:hypothetical protein A0256_22510 [Mucilaginibacter sp. PAMC 26640]|nr:hypothetical protein A0256_22510 [Mucilaginibacter sp. PAMC 26640]
MKILILNNDFRVYWKGRLVFLREYLAGYNISLYAVELFGTGSPYAFDSYDNKEEWWTCLFPNQSAEDLSPATIAERLFKVADELNADVIIGPSIVFYAGALGLRWARRHNKRFIMFDDGKTSQIKRNPVVQFVKDLLIGQSDALWLPTPDYDNEYTTYHQKSSIIFYGFDTVNNRLFKNPGKPKLDNKTIICVARLVPVKNLDNLLRAWQVVQNAGTSYELLIIGDGPEQASLAGLRDELGLTTVKFLGAVDNDQIPEWYHRSDAFILASLWESWGLVVNEGMAAGLPMLLSDKVNAAQGLLKERVNGYRFDPLDMQDMADVILRYIRLPLSQKEKMSAASSNIIDDMSYDKMGEQLLYAINLLQTRKIKRPGILARFIMARWNGKYNVGSWDKAQ